MNRRNFLATIGSLAFSKTLLANQPHNSDKSVVFLFLSGGMSHQDSFIVKPDTIDAQKPINSHLSTNVPGVYLGADFPRLANRVDKMRLVHSFGHNNAGHAGGSHWVFTGADNRQVDNGGVQDKPSYGSINARYKGATNHAGLPNYVRTSGHLGDEASWLGKEFNPFDINGQGRNNIRLNISTNSFNERRDLLRGLDSFNRDSDRSGLVASMDSFEQQAYDLVFSRANEVFDLGKEGIHVRNRYGAARIGQDLLLARRLVENGVGYVSLVHGGWDMHSDISNGYKRLAPEVDIAVSAFIDDIYQRGLQDKVLLVIAGEFGRTMLNGGGGRDHYSTLSPLVLAGGGITSGGIYGKSSSRLTEPMENRMTPQDLAATILHFLEVPRDLTYNDQSGRPQYLTTGNPISFA